MPGDALLDQVLIARRKMQRIELFQIALCPCEKINGRIAALGRDVACTERTTRRAHVTLKQPCPEPGTRLALQFVDELQFRFPSN